MRFVEVGSYKVECDGSAYACLFNGEPVDTCSAEEVEQAGDRYTIIFRNQKVLVSISQAEKDYLCGVIDALPAPDKGVGDVAPAAPAKRTRRSSTTA